MRGLSPSAVKIAVVANGVSLRSGVRKGELQITMMRMMITNGWRLLKVGTQVKLLQLKISLAQKVTAPQEVI